MSHSSGPGFAALELRERAVRFVSERGAATEDEVLAHVYGGTPPELLRARLAAPLLADERLEQDAERRWCLRAPARVGAAFTALVVVASGPRPARARIVRLTALHVEDATLVARFDELVNPGRKVPRYVAERLGLEPEALEGLPGFESVLDDLAAFLDERPVLAQDAELTWSFLAEETRRHGRALLEPVLLDVNDMAARLLELKGKPSLGLVAAQMGISSVNIKDSAEEARILSLVGSRLLALGPPLEARPASKTLRRGSTAQGLPDEPGVYVMRDEQQRTLYVGKARRLRSRMSAYVHRPIGATRRMHGLVGSVETVDATRCDNELEALILEEREIRRLQPRFNTVRQQRLPRYWIRRPAWGTSAKGRPLAPPRLELCDGDEGEVVGPFRNETLAERARKLARDVFELDSLRTQSGARYAQRLEQAWQFLHGELAAAEALARQQPGVTLLRKVLRFDLAAMLLPADPRQARYAVVRPAPGGVEVFVVDHACLFGWGVLQESRDTFEFVDGLLAVSQARTRPEHVAVVLRWFGAQHPPARLVHLSHDGRQSADAIEAACLDQLTAMERLELFNQEPPSAFGTSDSPEATPGVEH